MWLHRAAEQALRERLVQVIEAITATSAAAVQFWIDNELRSARDWSDVPDVRAAAQRLTAIAGREGHAGEDLLAAPESVELLATLKPLSNSDDYDGFALISREGRVLAGSTRDQVGARLPPHVLAMLAPAFRGEEALTRPYDRSELPLGPEGSIDAPHMFAIAPVRGEQGEVIAAFVLVIRADQDFMRIMSIARVGRTIDTYAFNRDGLMLSNTRHEAQLRAIGMIPDDPGSRSALRVHLRDPGGDLTRGHQPDTPLTARPLTRLIAAAVQGDSIEQVMLEPYRDYRGVRVFGAYRWLPQYGIGIATEVDVDAVGAETRPVWLLMVGLLGVLLLSALLVVASAIAVQLLRRRVEEVRRLGQYTLERKIGEGGMGEVYLARHALLRRPTAVKFIRREKLNEENLAKFEREVQLTCELSSPNTVEVYDFGCTEAGMFFYVMEYLPGLDIGSLLELEGALPVNRAVYILRQLCQSLAEAHARGLIHRDVKPPNIILTERGNSFDFVKVLDFGLVKDVAHPDADDVHPAHELAGTPPYMAPERVRDPDSRDLRSDLFSVGVIAFNLLTGRQPFDGNTAMEIAYHVVNTPSRRAAEFSEQNVPPSLDQLVADCLAKDPEKRPPSAKAIIARLDAIALEPWTQQEARRWWAANAKRVGTAAHEIAVRAARVSQEEADVVAEPSNA